MAGFFSFTRITALASAVRRITFRQLVDRTLDRRSNSRCNERSMLAR